MERWRDILGFEGKYQVSDCGRVRSLPRYGTISEVRILKPYLNKAGYVWVALNIRKHVSIKKSIHRMVLTAFIGPASDKEQCNHINGIKDDNRLENLEWCSASKNLSHAFKTGLRSQLGEKNPACILNDNLVREIRALKKTGISNMEISRRLGFKRQTIDSVVSKKTWSHVDREGIH